MPTGCLTFPLDGPFTQPGGTKATTCGNALHHVATLSPRLLFFLPTRVPLRRVTASAGPAGEQSFRRVFTISQGSKVFSAHILVTGANEFELCVNGQPAALEQNFVRLTGADVTRPLHPGINVSAAALVVAKQVVAAAERPQFRRWT